MNPRLASRFYNFAPGLSPVLRADGVVMLPLLIGNALTSLLWAIAWRLDFGRTYSSAAEGLITIVLIMSTIIFWVLLSAMVLQPFVTERAEDTLRQLLAQPSNRSLIWFQKTGLTLLLVMANLAFASLCLFFAFYAKDRDSMWTFILLIAVNSVVLCSTASVVSLYLKSGAALLALLALAALYFALCMQLPRLGSFAEEAFWIFTAAWCAGMYSLSYRLFRDMEV